MHHTTRSTTALLLLIKQFLNLFVDNTTLVDFFGPSNYPVQSLILSSSNTSKSIHQNLHIACRFLLNDAFKKTKYYSRLFRQATVVSIFHAVRFPYLTSLALSLNSSLHKNFLLSHGSHVLHKASSSSSLSDFSIAYGLLFTIYQILLILVSHLLLTTFFALLVKAIYVLLHNVRKEINCST